MRTFILLTFFICCFQSGIGQNNFLNLQGGVGLGWLSGNDYSSENQTPRSIPVIGVEYAGFGSEGLFVTLGADFMKKGAWELGIKAIESNDTIITNSFTSDFKYIVIPIMVHKAIGSEKVMLTLGGGLFFGGLVQHQHEVNTGLFDIRVVDTDTEDYNFIDFGVQFRIGLRARIDDNHYFMLNLNHQMGLVNTTNKTLVGGGGLKTNASFAQVGFGFLL